MDKKRWMILIGGFVMIEALILISNGVFYNRIKEMEETSRADRALFEVAGPELAAEEEIRAAPAFAGLRDDPLAPMVRHPKIKETKPASVGKPMIYEAGVQTGILIQ